MMTFAELSEIIHKLEEPFPAEDHKERPLKGGDRWFYIPWQKIRERLDQVCVWQDFYSDFTYSPDGQRCIVTCTIFHRRIQAPGHWQCSPCGTVEHRERL